MEQPFSKRRRLSPPDSTGGSSVTTNAKPTSHGSKVGSASRPSFLSPTKASLARFNPDLLPRPHSTEPRRSARKGPGTRTPTSKAKDTEITTNGDTPSHRNNELSRIKGGDTDKEERVIAPTPRSGLSAAPRRRSRTPHAQQSVSKSSQTQSVYGTRGATLAASGGARRPAGNTHDDINGAVTQLDRPQNGISIDQSSLDRLPATPTPHGIPPGAAKFESSEPSLPSTPSQLGLEAPLQRPKGLLFGTPDKNVKKKTDVGEVYRPSPLQSVDSTQEPIFLPERSNATLLGPKLFLTNLPKPPPTPEQAELRVKASTCSELEREVLTLGSSVLEDSLVSSWQEPAAKASAALQKQQRKLMDLSERLLRLQEEVQGLRTLADVSVDGTGKSADVHDKAEISKDTSDIRPISLPQRLAKFFPFLNDAPALPIQHTSDPEHGQNVKHVKVSGSKFDKDTSNAEVLLQSHDACFMSEDAVVEENLRITFDSRSLQILSISFLTFGDRGEVLSNRPVMEEWAGDNIQARDLSFIGRAVNRSSVVVKRRDECWRVCKERFSDLVRHENQEKQKLRHDEIVFRRKDMSLTVGWVVSLKDDGEAQSELSILTEFPQAWWEERILQGREIDDVRTAFDLLVRERGITEAIAAIAQLLFPSDY